MTHALELAGKCIVGALCVVAFFMAVEWLGWLIDCEHRNGKEDNRK